MQKKKRLLVQARMQRFMNCKLSLAGQVFLQVGKRTTRPGNGDLGISSKRNTKKYKKSSGLSAFMSRPGNVLGGPPKVPFVTMLASGSW